MKINAYAATDTGLVRKINEDSFVLFGSVSDNSKKSESAEARGSLCRRILIGVFDGMGGISRGEAASNISAATAVKMYSTPAGRFIKTGRLLKKICDTANKKLCAEIEKMQGVRMGSTVSMIAFNRKKYCLCNLGDSPAFLYRSGTLKQISENHVEKTAADPGSKPRLTQHLGIFPDEAVLEPYVYSERIYPSDRFIICSDGLTDTVSVNEIEEILGKKTSAEAVVKELLQKALDNGGPDNITVICADVT